MIKIIGILISTVVLVLSFQNCAKVQTANLDKLDAASLSIIPPQSCDHDGQIIQNGQSIISFQNSTVAFGETCQQERRICTNGVLSGSYRFNRCTPGAPAACSYNGKTYEDGASVSLFQNSSVAFGETCKAESRKCKNGSLDGSFTFETCAVGAPEACKFDGKTVAHGIKITAFQNSSVPFDGEGCKSQERTCYNGNLNGTYKFANCTPGSPAACLFDNQTVAHGQSVQAFLNSSVPFGETCTRESRLCQNGTLNGSYSFSSCGSGTPASCLINGQTIAHGQSIKLFKTSTVGFNEVCLDEARVCNNGSLNGSFTSSTCSPDAPASCDFNGQNLAHGQSVQAFLSSSVGFSEVCQAETRVCTDGNLSGSNSFGFCSVGAPKACLFNGQTIAHGQSVSGYSVAAAYDLTTCQPQARICNDGALEGSGNFAACTNYLRKNINVNITDSGSVDILIVVDNSASMTYEQKSMATRTSKFLEVLRGLNYQIAITTTTPTAGTAYGDGNIVKLAGGNNGHIIKSSMPEAAAQTLLSETVQREEVDGRLEQGIYAVSRVLERAAADSTSIQAKFLRKNSAFAALVISDENESANTAKNYPKYVLNLINKNYAGEKAFSFQSIITRPGDQKCKDGQGSTYGDRYAEFSRLTGGVIGSVCATDYSSQVAAIAEGVRKTAKTITLECVPAVDAINKIVVLKNGASYSGRNTMVGFNLVFDDLLPNGAYEVKYNCIK